MRGIYSAPSTAAAMSGIQLSTSSPASNLSIINNFTHDIAALGSATIANNAHGFSITSGGGFTIQHNSINMSELNISINACPGFVVGPQ